MKSQMIGKLLLVGACWAWPVWSAGAQSYPSRPVRLIVPTSPAGASDSLARVLGNELTRLWAQQAFIQSEIARWRKVIKTAGIRVD